MITVIYKKKNSVNNLTVRLVSFEKGKKALAFIYENYLKICSRIDDRMDQDTVNKKYPAADYYNFINIIRSGTPFMRSD